MRSPTDHPCECARTHIQHTQVPFADFLLTYHGFVQNDQPLMLKSRIKTIGVLIADEREGPFSLDLAWIKASRTATAARLGTVHPGQTTA